MRKLKYMGILLALVFGFVCIAGCGGDGSSADPASNFIGSWAIVEMVEDGETMGAEELKLMEDMGITIQLVLAEDKTASFDVFGEKLEGSWEAKDASTCALTFEGNTLEGKLADGKLTMEQDGTKMVWEKSGDAPTTSKHGPTGKDLRAFAL